MIHKYSPTNFHEMNLDWILSEIEKLKKTDSSESEDIKELEKLIKQIEQKNQQQDEELQEHEDDIKELQEEIEEMKIPLLLKKECVAAPNSQNFNDVYSVFERRNI